MAKLYIQGGLKTGQKFLLKTHLSGAVFIFHKVYGKTRVQLKTRFCETFFVKIKIF